VVSYAEFPRHLLPDCARQLVRGGSDGLPGKSTVSNLFKSHGVPVIDLDVLARVAVQPGSFALRSIVRHFGAERVLKPDGTLDREALGNIVFNDEKERRVLNGIVHPAVRRLLAWEVLKCWLRGQPICVVDAPLLIEAGLWRICGQIVVVYCSEQLQLKRLLERNGGTTEAARSRIAAQKSLSSKLVFADIVIDNSGEQKELDGQVSRVIDKLRRHAGWTWIVSWLLPPVGLLSGALTIFYRIFFKKVGHLKQRRSRTGKRSEEIELDEMIGGAETVRPE